MNKFFVIGIGYRPLDEKASNIIQRSDVILATERLFDVFSRYREFEDVKNKLKVMGSIHETIEYIRGNYHKENISVLADGDPMLFGFGKVVLKEFDKGAFEIFPDLSSIQMAFSRIKEAWGDAFLMSLHGGPDPTKRRKLEYEAGDIPKLLNVHDKIAVLTDRINNPSIIAQILLQSSAIDIRVYVCERLGYPDEKITEGSPEEISAGAFSYPNVVIILKKRG
ncbi:MAG: precorrin-6y C5,15-methyltransferase (decarboxylating), CbiE subunit [Nitrospirae bacterium]|nr:precorrin-6y C5,15-methyltransferase (decarboxylating), CbiE subunit [Nitrospirota bacterium]